MVTVDRDHTYAFRHIRCQLFRRQTFRSSNQLHLVGYDPFFRQFDSRHDNSLINSSVVFRTSSAVRMADISAMPYAPCCKISFILSILMPPMAYTGRDKVPDAPLS